MFTKNIKMQNLLNLLFLYISIISLLFVSIYCNKKNAPTGPAKLNEPSTWKNIYGGIDEDVFHDVAVTTNGEYVAVGYTDSYGSGNYDVWLVKISASGEEQWHKTYGGSNKDVGFSVKQTDDGGYILAGYTMSFGAGQEDAWIIKTDASGNEIWNHTFGGTFEDKIYNIQKTNDGGYIAIGNTYSSAQTVTDILFVKIDENGNQLFLKTFGGTRTDYGRSCQQTSDGGFVISGTTYSYGEGNEDAWLIRTNATGEEIWNQTYGTVKYERIYSVLIVDDGYLLVGQTNSFGAGDYDVWLVKTDISGNKQWDKTFGGANEDIGTYVQKTSDGCLILAGYTQSYGSGQEDVWIIKTDASGNQEWNKTFGESNRDFSYSLKQTENEGYIIAGYTTDVLVGYAWLIKTDSFCNFE